jgi:ribosomal protein L16 Arg81 hydroxylase
MTLSINKIKNFQNFIINDKPFYIKNALTDVDDYLSWQTVEECLNDPIKYKFECIDKDHQSKIQFGQIKPFWNEVAIPDKKHLFNIVSSGNTLVILNYGQYSKSTNNLCKTIENNFLVATDIHAYCSFSKSKSFKIHCDYASNFIIQCYGTTHWKVYDNRLSTLYPISNYEIDENELETLIDIELVPGDLIYIPSRMYHKAEPSEKRLSMSIPCVPMMFDVTRYDRNYYSLL